MRVAFLCVSASVVLAASLLAGSAEAAPAQQWSPAASMPSARYRHTATLLESGKVLVAGGVAFGRESPLDVSLDALLYDPDMDAWKAAGTIDGRREDATATLLYDGRLLLLGGLDPAVRPFSSGQLYDPARNDWSSSAALMTARDRHSATSLGDGRVLVLGGCDICWPFPNSVLASGEIYDPTGDSWFSIAPMQIAREGHTATLLDDGRVLVVGGFAGAARPTAEIYDPQSDSWAFAPEPTIERTGHDSVSLGDGRVLVVGGYPSCPTGGTGICVFGIMQPEIFDPRTDGWSFAGNAVNDIPTLGTLTLLGPGKVLRAGGNNFVGDIARSDIYDPVKNRWSRTDSMDVPRIWHTATLLDDGRVLVVGGYGEGMTATVEVYKPARGRTAR